MDIILLLFFFHIMIALESLSEEEDKTVIALDSLSLPSPEDTMITSGSSGQWAAVAAPAPDEDLQGVGDRCRKGRRGHFRRGPGWSGIRRFGVGSRSNGGCISAPTSL